jgi:hypothetical protein
MRHEKEFLIKIKLHVNEISNFLSDRSDVGYREIGTIISINKYQTYPRQDIFSVCSNEFVSMCTPIYISISGLKSKRN